MPGATISRHDLSKLVAGRAEVGTPGTAVQLSTTSIPCAIVIVAAETNNTNDVTVGGSTVVGALLTRLGIPLGPGDSAVLATDDVSNVYIDVITATEGVTYLALTSYVQSLNA